MSDVLYFSGEGLEEDKFIEVHSSCWVGRKEVRR